MKSKIIISEQEKQLIPAALLSSTGKIFGGCNIEFFFGGEGQLFVQSGL